MTIDAPLLSECVYGFRCWTPRAVGGEQVLLSANTRYGAWDPGWNVATCRVHESHSAPVHGCDCGLYAVFDHRDSYAWDKRPIGGAVIARGRIEVHHSGFRAEKARIVALVKPVTITHDRLSRERIIEELLVERGAENAAARYGVPLVDSWEEARYVALEHGVEVPLSLRPKRPERALRVVNGRRYGTLKAIANAVNPSDMVRCECTICGFALWANAISLVTGLASCGVCAQRARRASAYRGSAPRSRYQARIS